MVATFFFLFAQLLCTSLSHSPASTIPPSFPPTQHPHSAEVPLRVYGLITRESDPLPSITALGRARGAADHFWDFIDHRLCGSKKHFTHVNPKISMQTFKSLGAVGGWVCVGLTSVKVILLGDDLPPVLGALSRQLLGFIQATDGQGLNVLLEGLVVHLLQGFLHGAEERLHTALQVVRCLLRLDNEAQALYTIGPPGPAEHNVA